MERARITWTSFFVNIDGMLKFLLLFTTQIAHTTAAMAPKRYFDAAIGDGSSTTEALASSSSDTRKPREPKQQTTLFVSSLPFRATSTDLSTLFSDIGPLRRAFVVTDKESGKSKGVGYVTFAILEDAQRAEREMQGKSLDGKRKMRIEWAEKKAFGGRKKAVPEGEGGEDLVMVDADTKVGDQEKPERAPRPVASRTTFRTPIEERDENAVRTIVVTGLAACEPAADDKTIYKRARKIGDVEAVVYPAPLSIVSQSLSKDVAYIVYRTPNHAMTAVEKLHAHTFKGAQISVVLKKRADGVAKLQAHMRPETREKREKVQKRLEEERAKHLLAKGVSKGQDLKGADVNRGSRLIVRNLPFDVTDRDLRTVFLPYGPIYSIDVPQKVKAGLEEPIAPTATTVDSEAEDGGDSDEEEESLDDDEDDDDEDEDDKEESESSTSTTSPSHAPQVSRDVSKPALGSGRGFAFVWLVSRSDAANALKGVNGTTIGRGMAEKAQLKAAKGKAGREAARKALEETQKVAQAGRQVAVDWALSKKEWEMKKEESEAEETDKEAGDEEDDDDDSDLDPVEVNEDDDNDNERDEEEAKPALPTPSEQTTLFIRNLPYQTTEVELRDVFRAFGPLRYAKVTMDKATNRPRGTGFVCFWQKESADNAIRQAQLVEREVGSAVPSTSGQKNPFSAPSVLTADPSAPLTSSLNLHGRMLLVSLAVERSTAESLADANKSAREKKDKRNTHLMREGVPLPGTSLAREMSEKEKEKRLANFSIRKNQLSKNPSLFISKTRLSIRQLPLFVSNKMLKKLGIYAVREFDGQVKRGERADLTAEEKRDSQQCMEELQMSKDSKAEAMSNKKFKKFVGERSTAVIQSKVVLQNDRLDPITGLGRSRGYGFLEMRSFADALKVVRFVNGDKSLSKLMTGWYASELAAMVKGLDRDVKEDGASTTAGEDKEERQSRLKRVEKKAAQVKGGQLDAEESGRGGAIMVEFSIENVVVTKKRKERAEHSQAAAVKRKRREDDGPEEQPQRPAFRRGQDERRDGAREGERRDSKRPRTATEPPREGKRAPRRENWNQKTTGANRQRLPQGETAVTAQKQGSQMGGLIGRKRKEKKIRR